MAPPFSMSRLWHHISIPADVDDFLIPSPTWLPRFVHVIFSLSSSQAVLLPLSSFSLSLSLSRPRVSRSLSRDGNFRRERERERERDARALHRLPRGDGWPGKIISPSDGNFRRERESERRAGERERENEERGRRTA